MSNTKISTRRRNPKQSEWTRANQERRIEQGAVRINLLLPPDAVQALGALMDAGAPSKTAAISVALIAAASTLSRQSPDLAPPPVPGDDRVAEAFGIQGE